MRSGQTNWHKHTSKHSGRYKFTFAQHAHDFTFIVQASRIHIVPIHMYTRQLIHKHGKREHRHLALVHGHLCIRAHTCTPTPRTADNLDGALHPISEAFALFFRGAPFLFFLFAHRRDRRAFLRHLLLRFGLRQAPLLCHCTQAPSERCNDRFCLRAASGDLLTVICYPMVCFVWRF